MRLVDEGGLQSITTNAVAERAGVSIGTLYQYFSDKQEILDGLARREVEGFASKALRLLTGDRPIAPGDRVRLVVRAVLDAYGGRARVHRSLIEYGLGRGTSDRLRPLYATIASLLVAGEVVGADGKSSALTPVDAFVLTYAIAGILRTYVAMGEEPASRKDLEDALVRLATRFVEV